MTEFLILAGMAIAASVVLVVGGVGFLLWKLAPRLRWAIVGVPIVLALAAVTVLVLDETEGPVARTAGRVRNISGGISAGERYSTLTVTLPEGRTVETERCFIGNDIPAVIDLEEYRGSLTRERTYRVAGARCLAR